MFMWKGRAKLIGSTRKSKAMNSDREWARHGASLPIATSPWPDGEYAEVRSSQVESGEGCPGLLLAKQRPRAGWTHPTWLPCLWRQTETDSKGCTGQTGWCGLSSYLLFFAGTIFFYRWTWRWMEVHISLVVQTSVLSWTSLFERV